MTAETLAAQRDEAPSCRNCGAPAPGSYCPECGQETQARLPKFTQFMREAAGRYVALDGRLWKTLAALLFRPGFLTREYLAGRRKRYIRPARLFLVASLLLFAALRILVELKGVEVLQPVLQLDDTGAKPDAAAKAGTRARSGPGAGDSAAPQAARPPQGTAAEAAPAKQGEPRVDDDVDIDLGIEIPTLRKRIERFRHLSGADKKAQIVDGIFRYGPYAMFVLLPAFGFLLKVVYLGRARRYPARPRLYSEHLVFAAHNTAFLSLGIVAASVTAGLPRAALIVWILIYLVWSMRTVYGGSWIGIAARSFVIFVAYSILFGLVTAGLVVAAVVLR